MIYKPIAPIDPQVAAKLAADKRFGAKTPDQLVVDPLPELKTAMDTLKSAGSSMAFAYSLAGADQRGVTTRLRSKPWSYVLAVPLTDYTRAADDATVNAALTIAIGLLLSLLMAVVLTRSLVGPLRGLLHRATQVSTGDIDLREAYFGRKLPSLSSAELARWVEASDGLPFAALAELIISVCCLGNDLDKSAALLKELDAHNPSSQDEETGTCEDSEPLPIGSLAGKDEIPF